MHGDSNPMIAMVTNFCRSYVVFHQVSQYVMQTSHLDRLSAGSGRVQSSSQECW